MKNREIEKYTISYMGLKEGSHLYDFEIERSFFNVFENSEIQDGQIKIALELEKKPNMMILNFGWEGMVKVECDRCAEVFDHPVRGEQELYVKFGQKTTDDSEELSELDDVVVLQMNESKINLAQFIYEFIILSLPLKKVHGEDTDGNSLCNKEVIQKLEKLSSYGQVDEETDPRWDILRNNIN